ncbi:MAG: hypothetical protein N3B21_18475 [Clostridia bacterium]|nr:hypothetical protein [Clostridia bacterium]
MKLNITKLVQLMDKYCNGNYAYFARELGVDTSHLHRFINNGVGGGKKMVGGIIKFCQGKGLDFNEYIDL